MNTLTLILSTVAGALVGIPSLVVFVNSRKLKAVQNKRKEQEAKTELALQQAKAAEELYHPYERAVEYLEEERQTKNDLTRTLNQLQNRINTVVSDKEFAKIKNEIQTLKGQVEESLKKEETLYKQAKPIMERLEAERRRREEIERQARMKREEEERKARRKREEEEEEERRARRRRDEAAAASSYSSSSSWSSSSDSGSSWSGGGGDSSGGGSSDSW